MHEIYLAGTQNLSQYLQDQTSKEYKAITAVLNSYEFLASGVRSKAFDDEMYKRLRFTQLMQD